MKRCLFLYNSMSPFSRKKVYGGESAHLWLGKGMERAPVFGHEYGHSRGGVSLVRQAISERNLFLGPEKPRFSSAYIVSGQSATALALVNCCMLSLYLDCLSGFSRHKRGMGKDSPSPPPLSLHYLPVRS